MTESYKYKSKIATAISFIAMFIAYLGQDGLSKIMPEEYAWLIPPIIGIAAYIVTQTTENKRVQVAEQMIEEKYDESSPDPAAEYDNLNDEYNISAEDDEDGI